MKAALARTDEQLRPADPAGEPSGARDEGRAGGWLLLGIVLAALTEAIAGTALSLGRSDIIGDTHTTPDEFAWLDIGYTFCKFVGFLLAPWLLGRMPPRTLITVATLLMGLACGAASISTHADVLTALRSVQGLAGGVVLVAGQAVIFLAYPAARQPLLQAVFAMSAVVAPATLAPVLQGWLIDSQSWVWIFYAVLPLALLAAGVLVMASGAEDVRVPARHFDSVGLALAATLLFCLTYVLSQGNRWDWFQAPRIIALSTIGALALLGLFAHQWKLRGRGLVDTSLFASEDFSFAFAVSFVAGAALFGSAFLIPSFAVAVLGFTATDAGALLLPSGALFIGTLLLAAYLMQARKLPPVATVPFGILAIMAAMWMLSGSTVQSGAQDMMAPLLLRGVGLGLLFLSITLIAFSGLGAGNLASGIGLFNSGRQLGGLMGVAGLQTLIERDQINNLTVLSGYLPPGSAALNERLASSAAQLTARGMDALPASRAAWGLLQRSLTGQATVIAFDSAFNAVALLFVVAAPLLVSLKIVLGKLHARRAGTASAVAASAH